MSFVTTSVSRVLSWARSQSLWYITTGSGCCANEVLETTGCRYDLERFGCVPQVDPKQADLLFVTSVITAKAAPYFRELYDQMLEPKYVMAVGSCANCGGAFNSKNSYSTLDGAKEVIPIDVFVPGCPPRPEAIMNGLITLQEKISGNRKVSKFN